MIDEIMEEKGVLGEMDERFLSNIHSFVLDNTTVAAPYRE
jgi:hypothetical protein